MGNVLVINSTSFETRVALVEDGTITEYYVERKREKGIVGNIYKGRVLRVLPGMQAAFVDLGTDKAGFLYVNDVWYDPSYSEDAYELTEGEWSFEDNLPEPDESELEPAPSELGDSPGGESNKRAGEPEIIRAGPDKAEEVARSESSSSENAEPKEVDATNLHPGREADDKLEGVEADAQPTLDSKDDSNDSGDEKSADADSESDSDSDEKSDKSEEEDSADVDSDDDDDDSGDDSTDADSDADADADDDADDDEKSDKSEEEDSADADSNDDDDDDDDDDDSGDDDSADPDSDDDEDEPEHDDATDVDSQEDVVISKSSVKDSADRTKQPRSNAVSEVQQPDGVAEQVKGSGASDLSDREGETESHDSHESTIEADKAGDATTAENARDDRFNRQKRRGKRRGRVFQRSDRPAEAKKERSRRPIRRAEIQDLLKESDEIVVQVAKAPIGSKGARITTHVSLPGRHLVFMPTVDHVGISRRIGSDKERRRLRQIIEDIRPPGSGFIVRTVADGVDREKIVADARFLLNIWADMNKRKERIHAPALLHPDLDLILRATRDLFGEEVEKLVIDDHAEYQRLLTFMEIHMPALKDKVEHYKGKEPIFDAYGIEDELRRSQQRRVWLKSGGYLIIDQAEALTAIDVNSGRYIGKKNLEETITKINGEAAEEVVYQLRLRNMGGIIILDFIDMEKASNREKVYKALEEALRKDKAKTNILKISELGLVEMTRKRVRESITRMMNESCPYCDGRGMMKTSVTVAYEVLRDAAREAAHRKEDTLFVNCSAEVAALLTTVERDALRYTMERARKKFVLKAQDGYHREQYDLYAKNTRTGTSVVLGEGGVSPSNGSDAGSDAKGDVSGSQNGPGKQEVEKVTVFEAIDPQESKQEPQIEVKKGSRAVNPNPAARRRRRRRGRSRRDVQRTQGDSANPQDSQAAADSDAKPAPNNTDVTNSEKAEKNKAD